MPKEAEKEVAKAPEAAEPAKGARFIRGESVVDAEGKVVEGLSVKDGEIVGKEKTADK